MLPKRQKDRANWRTDCPEGDAGACSTSYHLTLASAEADDRSHKHDLEIERVDDS